MNARKLILVGLLAVTMLPALPAFAQIIGNTGNTTTVGSTGNTTQVGNTGNTTVIGSTGNTCGATTGSLANPLNACNIADLINEIITYVTYIGTLLLTLMLIYTGFKFVTAQGNEEKISSARTMLLWTVVGGLILLGAKAISAAISSTVSGL